jgi:hypothetical protein
MLTLPPSLSRFSREDVGTSTSHNPMGLRGLLEGYIFSIVTGTELGERGMQNFVQKYRKRIWILFDKNRF